MKKILVVDDDPTMLALYREILGGAGFEVHSAEDGTSAVVQYQNVKPDLILLDADMPAGGGTVVFRRLRSTLGSDIPIIFITGKPDIVADMLGGLKVALVTKPVSADRLLTEVAAMLEM